MTSASSIFNPSPDPIRNKANWLGRYLAVEKKYDAKLKTALSEAASNVDEVFGSLVKENVSTKVERVRIGLAHNEIRRQMSNLFGTAGYLIRDHRQDAAAAAVNAKLFDEKGVLSWLFPDSVNRLQYADNLRQSARRNVEATIVRVLHTEKPLSARVYKTQALANGLVGRTVNNALARGDSARNLAKDVRALIDPNVPGGVSYAAMRLGRTELNNAFHAQSILDTQETPWLQDMRWHLSKVHAKDPGDECETYAAQGTFRKEDVPEKPHPNCRCFVTPELPPYEEFEHALLAGQYDPYLDSVMGEGFSDAHGAFAAPSPRAQQLLEKRRAEKAPPKPKPVKWTGPKVAKPLDHTPEIEFGSRDVISLTRVQRENRDIWQDIENNWVSAQFDYYKKDLRFGARVAQRDGYTGFPKSMREIAKDNYEYGTTGDPMVLRAYGKEIVADAAHSKPTTEPFFRGMRIEEDDLANFQPGKNISLPLSSFDKDESWAVDFSRGYGTWESSDVAKLKNPYPIVLELEPGAKVSTLPYGERIAFGQFDIVDVIPAHRGKAIQLAQEVEIDVPTKVIIRQKSLIERAVEKGGLSGGKMTGDGDIPDYEFFEKIIPKSTAAQAKLNAKHVGALKKLFTKAEVSIADGVDPTLVKQSIEAVAPLAKRFPDVAKHVGEFKFGYTPDEALGYTMETDEYPKAFALGKGRGSKISLNAGLHSSPKTLQEYMDGAVKSGVHFAGVEENPAATAATHEFAHSINIALGWGNPNGLSPNELPDFIFNAYDAMAAPGDRNQKAWESWLLEQIRALPPYDRKVWSKIPNGFGDLDLNEALPESFETFELRPGRATPLEKIMHDFMDQMYHKMIRGEIE